MSMNGHLMQLTAELADRLGHDPDFALVVAGRGGEVPDDVAERLIAEASPQMRQMIEASPEFREAWLPMVAREQGLVDAPAGAGPELRLGKLWHGLHWLIARTAWKVGAPPSNAILGGLELGDADLGYGPARLLSVDEVVAIADALDALDEATLSARFDGAAMRRAQLYPDIWGEPGIDEELLAAFGALRRFYRAAADAGRALMIWLD